jgi:hypothetical protein
MDVMDFTWRVWNVLVKFNFEEILRRFENLAGFFLLMY